MDNEKERIDELAQNIRIIDGNHDMGAGEIAERLVELGYTRQSSQVSAEALRRKTYKPSQNKEV